MDGCSIADLRRRFESERFRLRPVRADDLEFLRALRTEPGLRARFHGPAAQDDAGQAAWFAAMQAAGATAYYVAFEKPGGTRVGYVQLSRIDWPGRTAEIGVVLSSVPRAAGGYGRYLGALVCAIGFEAAGFDTLYASIAPDNSAAIRGARHFGAVPGSGPEVYRKEGETLHVIGREAFYAAVSPLLETDSRWREALRLLTPGQTGGFGAR